MGDLIDLKEMDRFWLERRRLEKKYTVNGKLTREGVQELFKHASKHGRVKGLYLPDDYGTDDYYRNR